MWPERSGSLGSRGGLPPPRGAAFSTRFSRLSIDLSGLCDCGVYGFRGVAPAYGFAGSFIKLSALFCFAKGYLGSFSYACGMFAGSMSKEFRASRGVRLSRSRLSFSVVS